MLGELSFGENNCPEAVADFAQAGQAIAQRPDVLMQYSACLVQLSRFDQAAAGLQQVLALRPTDASARYDLALAQFRTGHSAEASAALAPASAAANPAEDELTLSAGIAEAQGQTQQALDLLRKAILLHPREKSAYLDFVNLAYQHESPQVGLSVVNLGLREIPNAAKLYFARGVLLCQVGKVDDRLRRLQPRQPARPFS